MLKDWNHDLVQQLSEVSDSLWRFGQYKNASKECATCSGMWSQLEADYEKHSKILTEEIKRHVNENRFD